MTELNLSKYGVNFVSLAHVYPHTAINCSFKIVFFSFSLTANLAWNPGSHRLTNKEQNGKSTVAHSYCRPFLSVIFCFGGFWSKAFILQGEPILQHGCNEMPRLRVQSFRICYTAMWCIGNLRVSKSGLKVQKGYCYFNIGSLIESGCIKDQILGFQ